MDERESGSTPTNDGQAALGGPSPAPPAQDLSSILIKQPTSNDETLVPGGVLHNARLEDTAKDTQAASPGQVEDHLISGTTHDGPAATTSENSKKNINHSAVIHGKSDDIHTPSVAPPSPVAQSALTAISTVSTVKQKLDDENLVSPSATQVSTAPPISAQPSTGSAALVSPTVPDLLDPNFQEGQNLVSGTGVKTILPIPSNAPQLPVPKPEEHQILAPASDRPSSIRPRTSSTSSSSGGSSPKFHNLSMEGSGASHSAQATGPPLDDTEVLQKIVTLEGHIIRPEIHARIDKGFFLSENDWTCYRRNYFSVGCSYSLYPATIHAAAFYLQRSNGQIEQINGFAMKISAAVEGAGGKLVELVQHTPKRDKGPQMQPGFVKLIPQSGGAGTHLGQPASSLPSSILRHGSEYDYNFNHPHIPQQQLNQAVYDRIQFKSATANNGKRRAAQQYYHLVVELYAEVAPVTQDPESAYVLVARRLSAPMVVRGRSPGHYIDEKKYRPASADGRGSGTQPSTPATAYAPGAPGLPSDRAYYNQPTLPSSAPSLDSDHYVPSSMGESDQSSLSRGLSYSYHTHAFSNPCDSRSSSHSHTPYSGYYLNGGSYDAMRNYHPVGISVGTYGDGTLGYLSTAGRSAVRSELGYYGQSREIPRVDFQRHSVNRAYTTETSADQYPIMPNL